jgi:negative modulator of initiation of replication
MRTIGIDFDDNLASALEILSNYKRVSPSQLVREIVMERIQPKQAVTASTTTPQPPRQSQLSPRDKAIRDYSQSPSFLASRSVVDQFLSLLSFLHRENPDRFGILESMEGRRRKYIGTSEQELEDSGTSVNPKRIPSTNYWVVTNNSTDNKKLLLKQVLTLLGYGQDTIRSVPDCLR